MVATMEASKALASEASLQLGSSGFELQLAGLNVCRLTASLVRCNGICSISSWMEVMDEIDYSEQNTYKAQTKELEAIRFSFA